MSGVKSRPSVESMIVVPGADSPWGATHTEYPVPVVLHDGNRRAVCMNVSDIAFLQWNPSSNVLSHRTVRDAMGKGPVEQSDRRPSNLLGTWYAVRKQRYLM